MLIIGRQLIEKLVGIEEVINLDREAYIEYSRGRALVPVRTPLEIKKNGGTGLFMPAYSEGMESFGVKVVSVFPGNKQLELPTITGVMLLNNARTGQPLALLEASSLTALRTGAASGLATELLANPGASTLAIIGCGGQALTQLLAVCAVRPIERVYLFDLDRRQAEGLILKAKEVNCNPEYFITAEADRAVEQAEVVVTVTTSREKVFNGGRLKPGTHINAVGAFTPEMQEIGEDTLLRADKVVVDSREAVLEEAGDIIQPIKRGKFSPEQIYAELGEIAAGDKAGREKEEEITFFETVGLALLDIALARLIYDKARKNNLGQEYSL